MTVLQAAARLGDALSRQAVDVDGFCEEHGISLPTANRAIRALRAAGFTVCSESAAVDKGRWMFARLYTMPKGSVQRWRKMKGEPVGSFGDLAIAGALKRRCA